MAVLMGTTIMYMWITGCLFIWAMGFTMLIGEVASEAQIIITAEVMDV